MKPLEQPNLPSGRVTLAAVSSSARQVILSLEREGIEVVGIDPAVTLPKPVASHSDLQLLHLSGKELLIAQEAASKKNLLIQKGFSVELLEKKLGNKYPNDVLLNFLFLKNDCYGMCSNMTLQLLNYCKNAGLQLHDVKQGYARCSVAVVSQNAVMTADMGLAKLLETSGIDVLRLEQGDILLPGYDTGFIGGCCGLISKNRLAFTGSLSRYYQGSRIKSFLEKHHVTPVELCGGCLEDIGGIIPLMDN